MAGYPLFPNGHVALFSLRPFPKIFRKACLSCQRHRGGLVFSGRQFCLAAHFPHESAANLSHELLIANLVPNKLVAAVPIPPPQSHGYERKSYFFISCENHMYSQTAVQTRVDPRHS